MRRFGVLVSCGIVILFCTWLVVRVTARGERETSARSATAAGSSLRDAVGKKDAASPGARVTGRVRLGPDGRWGAGVAVRIAERRVLAGASGRFFADAPAGERFDVRAQADGFERTTIEQQPLLAGEQRDLGILWLQRARTLVVRVINTSGDPVADARVVASGGARSTVMGRVNRRG